MTEAQSSDIVTTLERMATETALSWSDIRKPEQHEHGYEWYVAAINEVKVLRAAAEEIRTLRARVQGGGL
jgi:hypothetical protein